MATNSKMTTIEQCNSPWGQILTDASIWPAMDATNMKLPGAVSGVLDAGNKKKGKGPACATQGAR